MPRQNLETAKMVRVVAPARLHLGFLDPDGTVGHRFGSIGLAISAPATKIKIERAQKTTISGAETRRITHLLTNFQATLKLAGSFKITVENAIPAHAGLGSGTQLALAIGAGLQKLAGQQVVADDLGAIVNRGARSAIGIASFEQGGFIIDGGKTDEDRPPPVVARAVIPEHWRIVLALDTSQQGVHGKQEQEAFSQLKPLSTNTVAHLNQVAMKQMLPALQHQDFAVFGAAVSEMQKVIGHYFAPAQGGRAFSNPKIEKIVLKMGDLGGQGLGQSSWGPTGFAFCDSPDAAERLYTTLVEDAKASGIELLVVSGRNQGAQIDLD